LRVTHQLRRAGLLGHQRVAVVGHGDELPRNHARCISCRGRIMQIG
jgi:hypothetical protein